MMDVKNAFNSAPWSKILEVIEDKNIPNYLGQIVDSYLDNRSIEYHGSTGIIIKKKISCGVPQGSVLGPTLWNIMYDGLLRIRLSQRTKLLAFADDVAIIGTAEDTFQLKALLETVATRTVSWLENIGLHIAPQKTEVLVLTKKGRHNDMTVEIGGMTVNNGVSAVYLSITLDQKLSFTLHAQAQAEKANKMIQNITRILPNISAAKQRKRLLLSNAVHSLLLLGAPIWSSRMIMQGWSILNKVQRRVTQRVASAYRTVSYEAVGIVAGIPSLDLQATLRKSLYDNRQNIDKEIIRNRANITLIETWHESWNNSTKGRWTHTLIKNVKKWFTRKHGQVDYHITQALTSALHPT